MLKVMTSSLLQTRPAAQLRVLNSVATSNRRFFCSDVSTETQSKGDAETETKYKSEECFRVFVLPVQHKPLFPGFKMPVTVKDSKLLAALSEAQNGEAPFAGAFLVKDGEPNEDATAVTGSEAEKSVYDLKGKDLLNRLHDVGTLGQITTIEGEQVVLFGNRRIRITEMVDEEPLTVKIDHLMEEPYSRDDEVMKASAIEVISSIRYVLKTTRIWREYVKDYTQHIFDFNYPKIADFAAAVSNAPKSECQGVLEELDVPKRIQLSLGTLKKEREITKKQEIEEGKFDFLPGLSQMQQGSQMQQQPRRRQI